MNHKEHKNPNTYNLSLLALVLFFWGSLISFCFFTDPYAMRGTSRGSQFSSSKPMLHHQERLFKAYAAANLKPDAIVLGTSRQGHAISTNHPGFTEDINLAYNLSFDGAHIDEIYAYLKHAQSVQPLRRVLIGLDFSSFGAFVKQEAFHPELLDTQNRNHSIKRIFTLLKIYSTYDSLIDGYRSVTLHKEDPYWDLLQGIRTDRTFLDRLIGCGGTRENFRIREARDIRLGTLSSNNKHNIEKSLDTYRSIIKFAIKNNIEISFFISPTHARGIVLLELIGKLEEFENWKRQLVEVYTQESYSITNSIIKLWDFSGFNSVTTESLPKDEHPSRTMKGYWELSHYKRHVGELILNRIFPHPRNGSDPLENFGIELNQYNIENHIFNQRTLGLKYRSDMREELSDLSEIAIKNGNYKGKTGCSVL